MGANMLMRRLARAPAMIARPDDEADALIEAFGVGAYSRPVEENTGRSDAIAVLWGRVAMKVAQLAGDSSKSPIWPRPAFEPRRRLSRRRMIRSSAPLRNSTVPHPVHPLLVRSGDLASGRSPDRGFGRVSSNHRGRVRGGAASNQGAARS